MQPSSLILLHVSITLTAGSIMSSSSSTSTATVTIRKEDLQDRRHCHKETRILKPQRPSLLRYADIPSWQQDNEHLRSGYRYMSAAFPVAVQLLTAQANMRITGSCHCLHDRDAQSDNQHLHPPRRRCYICHSAILLLPMAFPPPDQCSFG